MKNQFFWTLCALAFCLFVASCCKDGEDCENTDTKKVQRVEGTIGMMTNSDTGQEETFFLVTGVETTTIPIEDKIEGGSESGGGTVIETEPNQDDCQDNDELAIQCEWDSVEQQCECLCILPMPCDHYRVLDFGVVMIDPIIHEDPRRLVADPKFFEEVQRQLNIKNVFSALENRK